MAASRNRFITPRRPLKATQSKSLQHYMQRTGEIIWAWNQLHEQLQLLFAFSISRGNPELGVAIWHAIPTDGSRRQALRAAIRAVASSPQAVQDSICWLVDAVDKLAPYRNDSAHAPMKLNWTEKAYVTPTRFAHPRHTKRITGTGTTLREFHRNLRDDLHVLIRFSGALSTGILEPGKYESFVSPLLKSIPSNFKPRKGTKKSP